jgi:hypothetical protein
MASAFSALLYSLHDSLMLLAPAGWVSVDLRFEPVNGALRVTELSSRGEGTKAPKPKPNLHVEPRHEAERLSDAMVELAAMVTQAGKPWSQGAVRVERGDDFAEWKLLRPDGSTLWFSRLTRAELDALLVTDPLFDAIEGTERAFHDLQHGLEFRLGTTVGFGFDPTTSVLTVRRQMQNETLQLPVQVVGQYLPATFTWVWAWSDVDAKAENSAKVRKVCAPDHEPAGMAALWRAHFHCDEGFAWALASHVVVSIGARGLFRAELPDGQGAVFFAVMGLPSSRPS